MNSTSIPLALKSELTDGSMVSIDCIAVENEYANNMYETSELDYLIYNEPLSYVELLLSGKIEEYLRQYGLYTAVRYEMNFKQATSKKMLPAFCFMNQKR